MSKHGSSPYISHGVSLLAEAEFQSFAPQLCVCLGCLNSSYAQSRTYVQIWDNRYEANKPCAPFLCCTSDEQCVMDRVGVKYFDRMPHRSGYLLCMPLTCCGPPAMFPKTPMCCFCIDMSPCFGQTVVMSPCNMHNCKLCICFGPMCYKACACPYISGLSNVDSFMVQYRNAVLAYAKLHSIPDQEVCHFDDIKDGAISPN
jgi:hypothetical protein